MKRIAELCLQKTEEYATKITEILSRYKGRGSVKLTVALSSDADLNFFVVIEKHVENSLDFESYTLENDARISYIVNGYGYRKDHGKEIKRPVDPIASTEDDIMMAISMTLISFLGGMIGYISNSLSMDYDEDFRNIFEVTSYEIDEEDFEKLKSAVESFDITDCRIKSSTKSERSKQNITKKDLIKYCNDNNYVLKKKGTKKVYKYTDQFPTVNEVYLNWLKKFYQTTIMEITVQDANTMKAHTFNIYINRIDTKGRNTDSNSYITMEYNFAINDSNETYNTIVSGYSVDFKFQLNAIYSDILSYLNKIGIEFNNSSIKSIVTMIGGEKDVREA